jgi:hypothetical protein
MSFAGFPTELPMISKAVLGLLTEAVGPPPDMRSLGQKTLEAFLSNPNDFDSIRKRDWRHVPYAIWIKDKGGLLNIPSAIDRYLNQELPKALDETRRPLKWGRPLVFTYIEQYNPNDTLFKTISKHAKDFFNSPKVNNASSIVGLARSLNLFDVNEGPRKTAEAIATSRRTLREWIQVHELWPSFGTSPFAEAAFNSFLQSNEDFRRSDDFINTIFEWSITDRGDLRYSASRARLADALLLPWRSKQPNDATQSKLITYLLKHYGDPRIGKNLWHGVSSEAVRVLIAWINGRTLEAFFRILQETADSIWQYRQKFWTAYFKAGHIDEAWVALGPDAAAVLKRFDDTKQLKYAHLLGSESSQSILLIRMGQIIFCEWSHNGRLRAQRIDSPVSPAMYKTYYDSESLRFQSLDFNNGLTQDPGLVHFSSQSGGWQERARLFIQKNIGIRMTQAEVTR